MGIPLFWGFDVLDCPGKVMGSSEDGSGGSETTTEGILASITTIPSDTGF